MCELGHALSRGYMLAGLREFRRLYEIYDNMCCVRIFRCEHR